MSYPPHFSHENMNIKDDFVRNIAFKWENKGAYSVLVDVYIRSLIPPRGDN